MSSTKDGKIDQTFALVGAKKVTVMNGVRKVVSGQKKDGKDYDFVKDRGKKERAARQIGEGRVANVSCTDDCERFSSIGSATGISNGRDNLFQRAGGRA